VKILPAHNGYFQVRLFSLPINRRRTHQKSHRSMGSMSQSIALRGLLRVLAIMWALRRHLEALRAKKERANQGYVVAWSRCMSHSHAGL
jgi:hypothetical protein